MTTMHATAIISAVDRASAVFRRVAMAAQSAAGRYGAATAAMSRFNSGMTATLGAGAAFGSAVALGGEYQIDKLTRLMQSAGELNDQQREMLSRSAIDASLQAAVQAQDIIRGQRELVQGGLDASTVARTTEMFAKIARTNDIMTATAAEDAINVANAMGFAMDTVENKVASLKRAMEFMSVVPNLSTESWEGLRTSLRYAAPVAGALKIPIEELGSALSVLADAGFKGEQGGTALRTILTRAVAPTRQARLEMRALGVALEDLYKFDQTKLGNMTSLRERLLGAGLGQGNQNLDKLLADFTDPSRFRDAYAMSDALQESLMKGLGIGRGDAEARGILQKVIAGHIQAATNGFDVETYFRGIANMPIYAMRHLFGIQRISQAEKLKEKLNEVLTLPTGEKTTKFRLLADEFERLMPGSIDRRFASVSNGFAWQIDRMMASLSALRNSVFASGVGNDLTGFFDRLSAAVRNMRETDPDQLRRITYGLAGLAALGPAGFILGGIATSFGTIAKALSNPAIRTLAVGGGIAALLGWDLSSPFMSKSWSPFGEETSTFLGPNAPILETARLTVDLFQQIALAGRDAVTGVLSLFNLEVGSTPLLEGLALLNSQLKSATRDIERLRASPFAFIAGKQAGRPTDWGLMDPVANTFTRWFKGPQWTNEAHRVGPEGLQPLQLLRDINRPVQVEGQAKVNVESKVRIEIDGPGRVVEQSGGSGIARVPLNTGRSMPDTGPGGSGYSTGGQF